MKKKHPKYFSTSWKVRGLLGCYHFFRFFRKKPPLLQSDKIKNILICNWAHLGDVLLSSSIIPALKERWPEAKIGFLASPASKIVLDGHPLIHKIHTASTWKQGMLHRSIFVQIGIFLRSLIFVNHSLIKEISQEHYDLAIDLHPFFPNCSFFLRKTNIHCFVQFSSAGLHPSRSYLVDFPDQLGYLPGMYSLLLQALNIPSQSLRPCIHFTNTSPLKGQDYIVLHMGTTAVSKEWPIHHWITLASKLVSEGMTIVFTGKGAREAKAIQEVTAFLPHFINLCDKLDWNDFISVIQEAQTLISVDTVAIHLAAYLNTPSIGLYFATPHPELWFPDYGSTHFLIKKDPYIYLSDPSFLKNFPNTTELDEITPEHVLACLESKKSSPPLINTP